MIRLSDLLTMTRTRLGDAQQIIWSDEEITGYLQAGYKELATALGVFWDITYLENLPRVFSYTQAWERAYLNTFAAPYDAGFANYTFDDERRLLGDERLMSGPAHATSHFEVTEGFLSDAGVTDIPATAELPKTLTALQRVLWDKRAIDAMEARRLQRVDSRYEITKGEVYGYIWQKDGIRTLRKVRVPAEIADTVTVDGSWGVLRDPTDLSTSTVTGTWGVPRRIPGHHPIGPHLWGLPRRPFLEGKNVRVEHVRQGRALVDLTDVCELPDRYALYLRDYAMQECLQRPGPGQDLALALHFGQRWDRGLARIARRLDMVDTEHISVLGGDEYPLQSRPPRPSLPWSYGSQVR